MQTKLLWACCAAALACAACAGDSRQEPNQPATNAGAATSPGVETRDIGKLDADIARLEAQAAKDPDDRVLRDTLADTFVRRGNVHAEARRLEQALTDYQNALSYKPDQEEAQERITQIGNESQREPVGDDGRPISIPAGSGAANANR
jgi:tetratricopeptide (TPR) repeat protein